MFTDKAPRVYSSWEEVHKWHRIATAAIEGSRLGRQQNKLTSTGCESMKEALLTVERLEVSKWKALRAGSSVWAEAEEFHHLRPVHRHCCVVALVC